GFGQTSGAIGGAATAAFLLPRLGPYPLMLVAAVLLLRALGLTHLVSKASPTPAARSAAAKKEEERGRFGLVWEKRDLLFVSFLTLVYNAVNFNGEFILSATVVEQARAAAASVADQQRIIGDFFGGYFGAVNVLTAVLQLFAVSRILKYGGVRIALLVMPAF